MLRVERRQNIPRDGYGLVRWMVKPMIGEPVILVAGEGREQKKGGKSRVDEKPAKSTKAVESRQTADNFVMECK